MKKKSKKAKAGLKQNVPAPALSRRRKWVFRLIALILVPLLALGGFELALRLAGYGYSAGFFESIQVDGQEFVVHNENFSLRFFPPQLARWPGPVMMTALKPTNTFRIFVLGESAARGEPEPPYAASRYLEALLAERHPGARFEVINLGITAINSHVILPIARDCARQPADLWIIYMGNNEMVGPFGAATVFGAKAPPLPFVRWNLAIQKTRLGQMLVALGRRFKGKAANASWGGMKMFLGNQLRADDPRREVVYRNFERNLTDIMEAGRSSGAKILLNTVAVNLRDCPPFASLANSNLPAADRAQFDRLFAAGCEAQSRGLAAEAAQQFEQAAKLDPTFAEVEFRRGECLAALTNVAAAQAHFQRACDEDALPFRADTRINEVIRKIGRRFSSDRFVLLDAAAELAAVAPSGVCGAETFYEHVHFNFDGNYRLGRAWAEQVERLLPADVSRGAKTNGWISQERAERHLGLSDWNRCAVVESVADRLQRPPLSSQLNNAQRLESLRAEARRLRQRMNPRAALDATKLYEAAIERSPRDHWLRENFAEFLESNHDEKRATVEWREVAGLLPRSCVAFYQTGRLWSGQEQWTEAETALSKAVALRPRLTEGWYELGIVHLGAGKFELALRDFERASRLEPGDATYCAYVGKALSKLNRRPEAIERYRQAVQLQTNLWETHFALADELVASEKIDEAREEYEQVLRYSPTNALAHLNVGVMQARLGRFDEALRHFEETLRLEPGNAQAREYFERVQNWKQRKR